MCAVLSHSVVSDSATPWTVARQAPLSLGILQARIPEWVAIPFSGGIFETQGVNLGLLYRRLIYAVLSHSVMSDSLQLRGL